MPEILGMNQDTVYMLIILLILIVLGIVTFHYYAYVSVGQGSVLNTGAGVNFTLLKSKQDKQMQ
jgi:hypothetical protein